MTPDQFDRLELAISNGILTGVAMAMPVVAMMVAMFFAVRAGGRMLWKKARAAVTAKLALQARRQEADDD